VENLEKKCSPILGEVAGRRVLVNTGWELVSVKRLRHQKKRKKGEKNRL